MPDAPGRTKGPLATWNARYDLAAAGLVLAAAVVVIAEVANLVSDLGNDVGFSRAIAAGISPPLFSLFLLIAVVLVGLGDVLGTGTRTGLARLVLISVVVVGAVLAVYSVLAIGATISVGASVALPVGLFVAGGWLAIVAIVLAVAALGQS